jgi:transcription antitermination protein NusB
MNIQARILARKMVLTYLYEKYTAWYAASNEHILKEISAIDITQSALEQKTVNDPVKLAALLNNHFALENYDTDMTYLIQHCFEKLAERGIDSEYIKTMAPAYEKFAPLLPELVNTYATTFQYDDMDIIDRVIFLLGYAEYMLVWTPKEVVLNEAIELAKKYGDEGSPKLVNGILHKIITAEAEKKLAV